MTPTQPQREIFKYDYQPAKIGDVNYSVADEIHQPFRKFKFRQAVAAFKQ